MAKECVLLVETDLLVRSPLAEYLRDCGYRVVEAASADEARQLVVARPHLIDVVLIDVDESSEAAFRLASWIRGTYPRICVILAGTAGKAAEKAGDLCEEGPMLAKPYDHQIVLDRIHRQTAARRRIEDAE